MDNITQSNIEFFVAEDTDVQKLEERINIFIQQNKLLNVSTVKVSAEGDVVSFLLRFNPKEQRSDRSKVFVRTFVYDDLETVTGFTRRFIRDEKLSTAYVDDFSFVKRENDVVGFLTYTQPDRSRK